MTNLVPDEGPVQRLSEAEAQLKDTQQRLEAALHSLAEAERKVVEREQSVASLEGELQHRVRNMLAVIRSVFSRTVETRTSPEELADHFRGRLDALARYHTGTLGFRMRQLNLGNMVRDELLLAGANNGDPRIHIAGPENSIGGQEAQSLGLALHELVTNSIKFGVLAPGTATGRLKIEWRRSRDMLTFTWAERGMSVLGPAPLHYGFGREYIEQSLPYQHDARTSFELGAGMLDCVIELPLRRARSPA